MKNESIQPEGNVPPVAEPVVSPAPVAPNVTAPAPSTQGWPDQTPQPAQIQYVVAQQSLEGISGMLLFWIIIFGLAGVSYATMFFASAFNPLVNSTGAGIVGIIFSPLIAAASLYTVVLIAMRKKLAIWASIITSGVMALNSIVSTIVIAATAGSAINTIATDYDMVSSSYTQAASSVITGAAIGAIVGTLIYGGLVALYFLTSKRVKQTLVK